MAHGSWSPNRRRLPTSTRTRILKRDGHTCQICGGARCGNHPLEIDHLIPLADGGTDDDTNLRAVGADPCHKEKSRGEQARGRARKNPRRQPEPHPGIIR